MKKIMFLFLSLSLLIELQAQTEDQIKKDLIVAFAVANANAVRSGVYYVPNEYQYDSSNKLIGQHYYQSFFSDSYTSTNEGLLELSYDNNVVSRGQMIPSGCGTRAEVDVSDMNPTFDDQNRVVRLDRKRWYAGSKNRLTKPAFTLEYEGAKLVKVTEYLLVSEGRNIFTPTVLFESVNKVTTLQWKSDTEVEFNAVSYWFRYSKKDKEKISSTQTYGAGLGKDKTFYRNGNSLSVFERSGKQVTKTHTSGNTKTITVFTHDEKNMMVSAVTDEYVEDVLQKRIERKVEYILPQGSDPAYCQYKMKNFVSISNGKGEVFEEQTDTEIRIRNADSTWGPWMTKRM